MTAAVVVAPVGVRARPGLWPTLAMAAAVGIGVALAIAQVIGKTPAAFDAGAYWAATPGHLYSDSWGMGEGRAAFLYSPAFADALIPLRALPEPVFRGLWQLGLVLVLVVMLRGWALVALAAAIPALIIAQESPLDWVAVVGSDIALGNIHVVLGAVAVLGLRYPGLWAIALLSKITPGVGILWFAFRREWRNLAIVLGVTAAIALVSFLYRPGDWFAWLDFLRTHTGHAPGYWVVPIALPVRLALAVVLLWWGARTDRPWVVPIAVGLSIPVPYMTMLVVMVVGVGAWAIRRKVAP